MACQQEGVTYEDIEKIAQELRKNTPIRPEIGIICGSGLGSLSNLVTDKTTVSYEDIPHFPVSTVPGHDGHLVFGKLSGKQVVLMKGRAHCYEGYHVQKLAIPIRTMKLLGVKVLFVTNAAGGINSSFNVGDVMIIKDHINMAGFAGINPLVGKNDDKFGVRFPPMSNAYDRTLREMAKSIAGKMGFQSFVQEGVYCSLVGPNFETVAEARFLRMIGVDVCGMSTVPEVLVARHAGMRVFGLSLVTNMVVDSYDRQQLANHEEVLETGRSRSTDLQALIAAMVEQLDL